MRSKNGRSFIEEARRAQIIASAIEVLAQVGYAGASVARIAEHAGISKGVVSYHFAGKDELMEQVVEGVFAEAVQFVLARMEGVDSARELLRTHILGATEFMRGSPAKIKAIGEISYNLRGSDGRLRYGFAANEELYRALEGIYEHGRRTGEFRDFDSRVMAVTHNAAVDAMFGYWVANPGHDLDAHARQLADLLDQATRRTP